MERSVCALLLTLNLVDWGPLRVTRCPSLRGTVPHFHDFSGVPQIETMSHIVTGPESPQNASKIAYVANHMPPRYRGASCDSSHRQFLRHFGAFVWALKAF